MEISDYITLTIGTGTMVTALGALFLSKNYNRLIQGQVEMQIRERITNARIRYEDLTLRHNEDLDNELVKTVFDSATEEFLNAYDEACQKYIDSKVDRERFKKSYFNEIQSIVENHIFKSKYDFTTTRYRATVKVYKEWVDLEK